MLHLGDITKISGRTAPRVNVIIGGSPCQDLSVAGKRAGLKGKRSVLFLDQIRIIKEMRDEDARSGRTAELIRPRFMVWENVPGTFSSHKGEDFRCVLEETARVVDEDAVIPRPPKGKWRNSGCIMGDGWSIAWRVPDAQFWGVPQRRSRIALVADFGGHAAPEILFEREGVSGNPQTCGETREETARDSRDRTASADKGCGDLHNQQCDRESSIAYTLKIRSGREGGGKGALIQTEKSATLSTHNDQYLFQPVSFGLSYKAGAKAQSVGFDEDRAPTLSAQRHDASVVYAVAILCETYGFPLGFRAENTRVYKEKATTVCSGTRPGFCNGIVQRVKTVIGWIARRLTPLECERLQGYPDGWTDIGEERERIIWRKTDRRGNILEEQVEVVKYYIDSNGKRRKTSDSARYKALGNSIAIPPWTWMLSRLSAFCGEDRTMASLFDGIGGFPLIWERLNGKGSCLWASEIDEFCVAVTKERFG